MRNEIQRRNGQEAGKTKTKEDFATIKETFLLIDMPVQSDFKRRESYGREIKATMEENKKECKVPLTCRYVTRSLCTQKGQFMIINWHLSKEGRYL